MKKNIEAANSRQHGRIASYVAGFALSILFTLAAYFIVQIHVDSEHSIISHKVLIPAILALAVAQLVMQLLFFLHLGSESGPRWKLTVFLSTAALVLIVVGGSLWIMGHLNYNMIPAQMDQYLRHQEGF